MPVTSSASAIARFRAGVVAIAATYVFFLLYAQFGLVFLIQSRGGGSGDIQQAMMVMGVVGLGASLFARAALRRFEFTRLLQTGYGLAALAALLGMLVPGVRGLLIPSALAGLGTAIVTVALAANLDRFFPLGRTGLGTGLGTGLAYAICNIPGVFDGTPALQSVVVMGFCVAGYFAAGFAGGSDVVEAEEHPGSTLVFVCALTCFFALIALDSAAFAVIQRIEGLKARTWGGALHQITQGLSHFIGAGLAGYLVDRGRLSALWPLTGALFLASLPGLQAGTPHVWHGPTYAVGISFYSVALVAYPVLSSRRAPPDAATRAAWMYGIAGWLASGMGVGAAQHLQELPRAAFLGFGVVILGAWLAPRFLQWSSVQRSAAVVLLAACLAAGLPHSWKSGLYNGPADDSALARGRRVYIEEGCLHCHSQYIRPQQGTADVLWWGPYRPLDRSESPPLVGNRRQGPDLLNVGLRRNPEWLRAHFLDPSLVSPGSRMPSYRSLFATGDTKGDDLMAYLASLGTGSEADRWRAREQWVPALLHRRADSGRGGDLFASACQGCHGVDGMGNGVLAPVFNRPALNLKDGDFLYAPATLGPAEQALALARIVKFGIPGTAMAGHEHWPDENVLDVVEWLRK